MMSKSLPGELRAELDAEVANLHGRVPGVIGCVVSTVDGRLVSSMVNNEADPQRVSAMAGSIVALGETIGREVMIGRAQFVVVSALNGILLLQRVPAMRELLVVGTLARHTTNLGVLLHETRGTAATIGAALDNWLKKNTAP